MARLSVLIIEDDPSAAARLGAELSASGHEVRCAETLDVALSMRAQARPDVVVLDRLMQGRDALAELRTEDGRLFPEPVLVLTSMVDVADRIAGLNAGADDYLAKPASPGEIEARLRALVRRPRIGSGLPQTITCGQLVIDRLRREAWFVGRRLALQPREFRLLEELAAGNGEVVSRRMLLERVWGLRFDPRTKLIETHISRLRDKLGTAEGMPMIVTERGSGYRLATS